MSEIFYDPDSTNRVPLSPANAEPEVFFYSHRASPRGVEAPAALHLDLPVILDTHTSAESNADRYKKSSNHFESHSNAEFTKPELSLVLGSSTVNHSQIPVVYPDSPRPSVHSSPDCLSPVASRIFTPSLSPSTTHARPSTLDNEFPKRSKAEAATKRNVWIETVDTVKYKLINWLSLGFSRYAEIVYDHAWKFIIISFIVTSLLGVGLLYRRSECQMYKLYSLPNTPSQHAKEELLSTFTPERITLIFATSSNDRLDKVTLTKLDNLNSELKSIQFNKTDVVSDEFGNPLRLTEPQLALIPDIITYEDVCVRDAWDECSQQSVLEVYSLKGSWGRRPIPSREFPTVFNVLKKQPFRIDALLGNMTVEERMQGNRKLSLVRNATAFSLRHDFIGADPWVHFSAAYEERVQDLVRNYDIEGLDLTIRTERSINDELNRASRMDLPDQIRLLVAVSLVVIYGVFGNTTCSYRNKSWVAFMGVVAALLGWVSGSGMLHLFGVLHTPPAEATPFLAIGIGVDDVFVMLNAFSLTYPYKSGKERLRISVRDAGISITITTLTNIIAFIIGAVSPYFSVSRFCIITASSLLMGYITCLTFFLGWLALDARREEAQALTYCSRSKCGTLCIVRCSNRRKRLALSKGDSMEATSSDQLQELFDRIDKRCQSTHVDDLCVQQTTNNDRDNNTYINMKMFNSTPPQVEAKSFECNDARNFRSADFDSTTYELVMRQLLNADQDKTRKRLVNKQDSSCRTPSRWRTMFLSNSIPLKEEVDEGRAAHDRGPSTVAVATSSDNNNRADDKDIRDYEQTTCIVATQGYLCDRDETEEVAAVTTSICDNDTQHIARLSTPHNGFHEPIVLKPSGDINYDDQYCLDEPVGNVGRKSRRFLLFYYGRWLSNIYVKILVLFLFLLYILGALYGLMHLKAGLALIDVTPDHSYLRDFYETRDNYFTSYGEEVTVFFPHKEEWWRKDIQEHILDVKEKVNASDYCVFLVSSLTDFLEDRQDELIDGDKENFHTLLEDWLDGKGRSYKKDIIIDPDTNEIKAWKLYYWMPFVDNTRISYYWLQDIKNILNNRTDLFYAQAYTPLSVMWESDPRILEYTLTNMAIALLAIILVATILVPDWLSALLVVVMIAMVDLGLFGYMPYWNLELNMLTMVNLLISIGFSVDYTAHMVHTFAHCMGPTRNARMIESLVIMGNPVTHGMISTLLAVVVLSTADKYALVVFFQMISMVLLFAFAHGVILLPVILSFIGPMPKRKQIHK